MCSKTTGQTCELEKLTSITMSNYIFQEIDNLHSELERMDKSAKLSWLVGERMRLNRLANQFAQYIAVRGGFANNVERAYASRLLDMINMVDAKGAKEANDLAKNAFKELGKRMMK